MTNTLYIKFVSGSICTDVINGMGSGAPFPVFCFAFQSTIISTKHLNNLFFVGSTIHYDCMETITLNDLGKSI